MSGRIRKRFVKNVAVDLDEIRNWNWNAERMIVFHTVIFQYIRLVSGARNICDQINSHTNL